MNDISAPSGFRITQAISAWQSARARLLNDDLERDEAALSEMLGPEEGDVEAILERLVNAAIYAKSMAEAVSDRIANLADRRDRYKYRNESMRATIFAIMDAVGKTKLEFPEATISTRVGQQTALITDEASLPDEYVRVEVKRTPDRAAILADLKQGVVIDGAVLANGVPSLAIRSK